jgi:dTDP-D-glucose 4,6-dehydratase
MKKIIITGGAGFIGTNLVSYLLRRQLGWRPREDAASGLRKTVQWYLHNRAWWERILNGNYSLERLGLAAQSVVASAHR